MSYVQHSLTQGVLGSGFRALKFRDCTNISDGILLNIERPPVVCGTLTETSQRLPKTLKFKLLPRTFRGGTAKVSHLCTATASKQSGDLLGILLIQLSYHNMDYTKLGSTLASLY